MTSVLIGKDDAWSTLCHSCRTGYQQRVLKTFPGSEYLSSKDGVLWFWRLLVNLHVYHLVPDESLKLLLMESDDFFSNLYHIWRFDYQQKVIKTFPGSGYLHSEDVLVGIWHLLVNLCLHSSPFYLATTQSLCP